MDISNYHRKYLTDVPHPYNKIGDGPEGPEIRTVADTLARVLIDKLIISTALNKRCKAVGFNNIEVASRIYHVKSYGKKLLIYIENFRGLFLIIFSFGMTGVIRYTEGSHTNVKFDIGRSIKNGRFNVMEHMFTLFFDDARNFGGINVIPFADIPSYFSTFGPDLLEASLNENTWIHPQIWENIFKKHQDRKLCVVLLDQSIIAGVGNYLVSEILYYARLHPERVVKSLSNVELENLRYCAHKVIFLSYSYGGLTIKNYITPDGSTGKYPAAVYGKNIDPLGNYVTSSKTCNGRTSYWVQSLQV